MSKYSEETQVAVNVHVGTAEEHSRMYIESTGAMCVRVSPRVNLFFDTPESIAKLVDELVDAQLSMANNG